MTVIVEFAPACLLSCVGGKGGGYMYYGFLMMQLESDRQLCRLGVQLL